MSTTTTAPDALGIAEVAAATGLSQDTLRWYEKEGLVPPVARDHAGRRRYDEPTLRIIQLIVRLRRTGMPLAEIRSFGEMYLEGAASHSRRMALLTEHRTRVLAQLDQLRGDLAAVEDKIGHYAHLVDAGLDCDECLITDPTILTQQRSTT